MPLAIKNILIFLSILLNVARGDYTIDCNFLCENVDIVNRYNCHNYQYSSQMFTLAEYWDNSWMARYTSKILVNNTNNCLVQMTIPVPIFESTKIEVFHMINSNVNEIFHSDFLSARNLVNLSLSHNAIEHLPSYLFGSSWQLHFVDLSFNKINKISENAFEKRNDGTNILPSYYDYPDSVKKLTFLDLRRLYLNNNYIKHLESKIFSSLKNLEILTLNNNLLYEIDANALFGKNLNLKDLRLNGNQLTKLSNFEINSLTFLNISENSNLDFSNSVIDFVHVELSNTNAFTLIIGNRVKQLKSNNNQISQFYPTNDSFTEFPLVELDLANNSLSSVENLTYFENLTSINLSYNSIETVDKRIFEKMFYLQNLSLAHNLLQQFDSNIFLLVNLTSLDISYNRLMHLNINVTADKLRMLYLAGNHFTAIESGIKQYFSNLEIVSLEDNDWECRYLLRKILRLRAESIQIKRTIFEKKQTNRHYDSHVMGIGCFSNSPVNNIRKNQLKKEIESMIDQKLLAFELKMAELIKSLSKN